MEKTKIKNPNWHTQTGAMVAAHFDVDPATGLDEAHVKTRQQKYGVNVFLFIPAVD